MKAVLTTLYALLFCLPIAAQPTKGLQGEALQYSVNWPSGLSLGEARLGAAKSGERYAFNFHFDASVPGFSVNTDSKSTATAQYCAVTSDKETVRGSRKSSEHTGFDQEKRIATRETKNGGKAELPTPACGKDALSYLYFLRQELAQGRLPVQQDVFYGSPYNVRVEFGGRQSLKVGSTSYDVDRLVAHIKGPSSNFTAEIFLSHDEVRTPVLLRVPLALGTFSMELDR